MGIPRFYKWYAHHQSRLRSRYPQIRLDLTDNNKQVPVIDNIYLDFNGIIYRCLSDYECFLKNKFDPISFEEIYDRVYEYMLIIIEKVDPKKLIFIAFDGVAPRAKINQSRDRRFRAIQDRERLEKLLQKMNIKDQQKFQPNSISPGTDFLTNLCSNLKKRIMALFENQWRHLKVFFSDCLTPGEGQHKIMDFIRQSKRLQYFEPTTTHCVYSADADVILLCISLNVQNICIIRENSTKNSFGFTASTNVRNFRSAQFEYIFLNILREYFKKEFHQCLEGLKSDDIQPIINDFILLMAFVGNDFLPVEFCFTIKESHMENLFRSYKQYLNNTKKFINNNGVIDWSGIQKLLEIAKKFEAEMLDEKIKNKKNLISQRQMQKQSTLKPIRQEKEEDQQSNEDDEVEKFQVQQNKIVKGKQFYYKTRFGIDDINTDPRFNQIIMKYIEGLEFYNQYYFNGVPSWTWSYTQHYTPLLSDVYEFLSTNPKINIKLNKGQPFDPFLALMFMLPEGSFHILPKPLQNALKDQKCQLRSPNDYYPLEFKLDKYETLQFHKRALIPFLNENDVRKVYQSIDRNQYSPHDKEKNGKSNTIYFRYVGNVMSGSQIYFGSPQSEKSLVQFLKDDIKSQKKNAKDRFPSLNIYGDFTVDQKAKIQIHRKYKFEGSPMELVFYNNFIGFVEEKVECSQSLRAQVEMAYRQIGLDGKCTQLYKVKQARKVRQFGYITFSKTNNQVRVPGFALFKLPKLEYIPEIENFQFKDLYNVGERVIILNGKYFGYQASIQKINDKSAELKLTEPSCNISQKIQQNEQPFYSLEQVADQFQVDPEVLLVLLDQIIIQPKVNNKNKFDEIFPTAVNMGLNIINSQKGLLLPQYARCQMEFENTEKIYEVFKKVQLSGSCIEVLKNYMQNFEWIVDYIEDSIQDKDFSFRKGIPVRNIISLQSDVNLKLYQEFVKLYKFGVNGYFQSIYSKISNKDIPQISPTQRLQQTVTMPYHEFISKKQAKICPPALRSQPQFHDIGDQVILLRTFQIGYVIAIDDNKVIVKLAKRKNPVSVSFLEAFNRKWGDYLMKEQGKCWNMQISYYSPTHYSKIGDLE